MLVERTFLLPCITGKSLSFSKKKVQGRAQAAQSSGRYARVQDQPRRLSPSLEVSDVSTKQTPV